MAHGIESTVKTTGESVWPSPQGTSNLTGTWATEMLDVAGATLANLPALVAYSLHPGG